MEAQISVLMDSLKTTQNRLNKIESDLQKSLDTLNQKQGTLKDQLAVLDTVKVAQTEATAKEANQKAGRALSTLKTILVGGIGVLVGTLAAKLIPKATQ